MIQAIWFAKILKLSLISKLRPVQNFLIRQQNWKKKSSDICSQAIWFANILKPSSISKLRPVQTFLNQTAKLEGRKSIFSQLWSGIID